MRGWKQRRERRFGGGWMARADSVHVYMRSGRREKSEENALDEI